jgi:predicted phosphoribosyltransferase
MTFLDRTDAGRRLAMVLSDLRERDPVIVALPRGGVPVAVEVARLLDAPLDLILVRKLGVPGYSELAMGAVVDGAHPLTIYNGEIVREMKVSDRAFEAIKARELDEIRRRRHRLMRGRKHMSLTGRLVILIDDGIATGATVRAALRSIRAQEPAELILAVPVAATDVLETLSQEADNVVCLEACADFGSVGAHYADFGQLSDDEVLAYLSSMPAHPCIAAGLD